MFGVQTWSQVNRAVLYLALDLTGFCSINELAYFHGYEFRILACYMHLVLNCMDDGFMDHTIFYLLNTHIFLFWFIVKHFNFFFSGSFTESSPENIPHSFQRNSITVQLFIYMLKSWTIQEMKINTHCFWHVMVSSMT